MDSYSFRRQTTLLNYPLNKKQHVKHNLIIPTFVSWLVYMLHFAADIVLAYQHHKTENEFYRSLTLFWVFLPVIACFTLTVSNLNLWPEEEGFGILSVKWLGVRILQHLLFPVWAMFRYAELIFWRIEAYRCQDENEIDKLIAKSERRSLFDFYHFLQAYLQAVPQILFQIRIIMQHPSNYDLDTVNLQVMSIIMSLIKISMTTALYQRFQSQKLAGREYPWDKAKEKQRRLLKTKIPFEEPKEPEENPILNLTRRPSALSTTSSEFLAKLEKERAKIEPPIRVDSVKGLGDDDTAGKLVAILWWFCFLLPRMFTLSIFATFFLREAVLLCVVHYLIVFALLIKYTNFKDSKFRIPETKTDGEQRRKKYDWITELTVEKIAYFLVMSFIYIFCLVEIQIRFVKVKVVYNCYFIIIYLQNFIMMYMWYFHVERLETWWYDYLCYVIIGSTLLSILSMAMYLSMFRPREIVVKKSYRHSQLI